MHVKADLGRTTKNAPMQDDTTAAQFAISKYLSERIPRYTSYPTAPHFSSAIGPATYRDWLAALPATDRLSLYLHIPFCKTLCWYCGCNTSVTRHREPSSATSKSCKPKSTVSPPCPAAVASRTFTGVAEPRRSSAQSCSTK